MYDYELIGAKVSGLRRSIYFRNRRPWAVLGGWEISRFALVSKSSDSVIRAFTVISHRIFRIQHTVFLNRNLDQNYGDNFCGLWGARAFTWFRKLPYSKYRLAHNLIKYRICMHFFIKREQRLEIQQSTSQKCKRIRVSIEHRMNIEFHRLCFEGNQPLEKQKFFLVVNFLFIYAGMIIRKSTKRKSAGS